MRPLPSNEQMIRAVILSHRPCYSGWKRAMRDLKAQGTFRQWFAAARINHVERGYPPHVFNQQMDDNFLWVLSILQLPGHKADWNNIRNRLESEQAPELSTRQWRIMKGYAQKVDHAVTALERAYKALSPADRRRRTWVQRKKR